MTQTAGAVGAMFIIIWALLVAGCVVGWVCFLVAAWKMMKAHEALAGTMQQIALTLKTMNTSNNQNNSL